METRAPVTNQQLRQRRSEQVVVDDAHSLKVATRRNSKNADRQRRIRRVEAEEQGRSVRPYRRQTQGDEETSA